MSPTRRQARLSNLGEFHLIQSIPRRFSTQGFHPTVGTGDDAAVLPPSPLQQVVLSTDLFVEDVHFTRKAATFYDIGYKAAAANLSDIAAMGATPTAIFVAIALPPSLTYEDWQEFYRGLAIPCKRHKVQLLGGDTSSSPSTLFIAITITGQVNSGHILTRQGAKVGDRIYVSGTLGDSAAGLAYLKKNKRPPKPSTLSKPMKYLVHRHLQPTARIALGQLLASQPYASAAMDLSDGLSGDLRHLCRQSQVGALIHSGQIPMSKHMQSYAKRVSATPLQWSLHGGEDYELLFTIPSKGAQEIEKKAKTCRIPITQIGIIQPKRFGIRIEYHDRTQHLLPQGSYEHFSP
jgi:thiamine-monophosphate kinase